MRFGQIVVGPAGCGKSTYCLEMERQAFESNKRIKVVNLDPGAEYIAYEPYVDIRELVDIGDILDDPDLDFSGPNGALIFAMEFLTNHLDWLHEQLGVDDDNDYFLFDCPGQVELYTHLDHMKIIVDALKSWNFALCAVFTMDAHFISDGMKYISGTVTALSTLSNLDVPFLAILTKMDQMKECNKKILERYLIPSISEVLANEVVHNWNKKYLELTESLGEVIDNYSLIRFFPFNIRKKSSKEEMFLRVDMILGVSEDADIKPKDLEEEEVEND